MERIRGKQRTGEATTTRNRAGWLSGAITAAAIAVNCPPPTSAWLTSSGGQPGC
jgi:hypothetical protein